MIFASGALSRFSPARHVPPIALIVAAVLPTAVVTIAEVISDDALLKVISFAAAGIYIAFQLVVLAALIARSRGWIPKGKFTLGRWGFAVNIAALVYGVGGALNLAWPRQVEGASWYDEWIVVIGCAIVVGSGLLYMLLGRPYLRGTSPAGDAIASATTVEIGDEGAVGALASVLVALAQDRARVDRDQHDRGEL